MGSNHDKVIQSSLADASVIGTVFVASIGGHSGKNANSGIAHDDGKRKAKQQRATLMAVARRAAKKGFFEKDQPKKKVAV